MKNSKKMGGLQGGGPVGGNEEKKVCLWPIGAGTTCGKTFSKFDSLKRHLAETHKGMLVGVQLHHPFQIFKSRAVQPIAFVQLDFLEKNDNDNSLFIVNLQLIFVHLV